MGVTKSILKDYNQNAKALNATVLSNLKLTLGDILSVIEENPGMSKGQISDFLWDNFSGKTTKYHASTYKVYISGVLDSIRNHGLITGSSHALYMMEHGVPVEVPVDVAGAVVSTPVGYSKVLESSTFVNRVKTFVSKVVKKFTVK